jgi:hypothetical protein
MFVIVFVCLFDCFVLCLYIYEYFSYDLNYYLIGYMSSIALLLYIYCNGIDYVMYLGLSCIVKCLLLWLLVDYNKFWVW